MKIRLWSEIRECVRTQSGREMYRLACGHVVLAQGVKVRKLKKGPVVQAECKHCEKGHC